MVLVIVTVTSDDGPLVAIVAIITAIVKIHHYDQHRERIACCESWHLNPCLPRIRCS